MRVFSFLAGLRPGLLAWVAFIAGCGGPSVPAAPAPTMPSAPVSTLESATPTHAAIVHERVADIESSPEAPTWSPEALARARSMGVPSGGRLMQGIQLPALAPGLRRHPDKHAERGWGTPALVQGLLRAAARVQAEFGSDTWTVIGDLSLEQGGDIEGHGSHQNGRDVDVMFHLLDAHGRPRPGHPIPLDRAGQGTDYRDLRIATDDLPVRLDVPRTWAFVAALLTDEHVHVQLMLIAEHLRGILLAYARGENHDSLAIARFEAVTCQPKFPHDDHIHIRVFCSVTDLGRGCKDVSPIYPWHRQHLRDAGFAGKIVTAPNRRSTPARVKSTAEARADADASGPLHPDVVAFLERRQSWVSQPHPGRTYCK